MVRATETETIGLGDVRGIHLDGELLGVTLPRVRGSERPGRGVLVADPAWGFDTRILPIQVATS